MAYSTTYITTQGAILAAKTLQSKTISFSKFAIGSGEIADGSVDTIKALTGLVNQELNFDITKISRETDTQVTVRGLFKNTDAEESFYLRELGLFAIDPDTQQEILFAYINFGTEAEYINNSITEKKEHYYDMIITIDNANNVTITVDPSTVYVNEQELNERMKGTVLYENTTGTTENITLSDNYDNYVKFDIYVKEGIIITCYNNSSNDGCNICYAKPIGVDTVSIQIKTQQIFFKDNNTITRGKGKTIGIGGTGQGVTQNIDENMIITKVVGRKE